MPTAKLLEIALELLELEEDRIWDAIAKERDIKNARYFSHDKA